MGSFRYDTPNDARRMRLFVQPLSFALSETEEVTMELLCCPLCASTRAKLVFQSSNRFDILRCESCDLAFTDARRAPPASELYATFDQSDGLAQQSGRQALGLFLQQRAQIVRSVTGTGRLLDFGCGNGSFARLMSARGFEVVGLEPFSMGATIMAPNLELIRAPLDQVAPSLGGFDVITLWQVLEHLEQPVQTLRALCKLLNPDGVIVVSVPNFQSWQSNVFGGRWFHLDPPRHLLHFEPRSLTQCLLRAGLFETGHHPFLPEYGTTGWIQSMLNMVLPHTNFLYEFAKDRGALVGMNNAARAAHLAVSLVAAAPIFLASLPVEWAASRSNRAATLTVLARPR